MQLVSPILQCVVCHADVVMYRGRRAIEEATQRLTRAMDRADADLGRAHRSRRGGRGVSPGDAGYPTNGHKDDVVDDDDEGVHRLGRTAEHDYDRYVCQPMMGDLACVHWDRPLAMQQSQAAWVPVAPCGEVLTLIKSTYSQPSRQAVHPSGYVNIKNRVFVLVF